MNTEILWADHTTIQWDGTGGPGTSATDIPMCADNYVRLHGNRNVTLRVDVLLLRAPGAGTDNAAVVIQTAPTAGGPWSDLADIRTVNLTIRSFGAEAGASQPLSNYVRWVVRVLDESLDAAATFRIGLIPADGCACSRADAGSVAGPGEQNLVPSRWITVHADSVIADVSQSALAWLKTDRLSATVLQAQAISLRNARLDIEGALTADGPWTSVLNLAAVGDDTQAQSFGGSGSRTDAMYSVFRWRLTPSASGAYSACFQVKAIGR